MLDAQFYIQLCYGGYVVYVARENYDESHVFTDVDTMMQFLKIEILLMESKDDENENITDSVEKGMNKNK